MLCVCEVVELKEELLDDVPARAFSEGRRCGFEVTVSESEEEVDFGGESCSGVIDSATLLYGLRVRRIGTLSSTFPSPACETDAPSLLFGRVKEQFSQGLMNFLTSASYVFWKFKFRLEFVL